MSDDSEKVFQLFNQLRGAPVAERQKQLDHLCRDDMGLRSQVQQLLSQSDEETGWVTGTENTAATIPNQMGMYRIVRRIGQGGMGDVYEALHTELDRVVALKTMRLDHSSSENFVSRFKRERRLIAQVDSPHVVRVTDAGFESGVHFLAMECLKGNDLKSVIDSGGPMSTGRSAEVVRQSLIGLAAINDAGLVHRDIKPSNLFLNQDGIIKILDLGIAKPQSVMQSANTVGLTQENHIVGTPDFLSPEQASGVADPDIRSDIYSLGCVWYYLLTGKPPYPIEQFPNPALKIAAHINEPFPKLNHLNLPPALRAVLNQMVAKNRDDRPANPLTLAKQIESQNGFASLVDQQCVDTAATRKDSTAVALSRPSAIDPGRRTAIGVCAGAAAVLGVGFGWRLLFSSNAPEVEKTNSVKASRQNKNSQIAANGQGDVATVLSELMACNPGLKSKDFSYKVDQSGVPTFESDSRFLKDLTPISKLPLEIFMIDNSSVFDLSPLAALTNLQIMQCSMSLNLTSLEPIRNLSLINLQIYGTRVEDLSPVGEMPLEYVDCHNCPIDDLSLLRGKPLRTLDVHGTKVSDLHVLGPIQEMDYLDCSDTEVDDLKPLMQFPALRTAIFNSSALQKSAFLANHPNANKLKCNGKKLARLFSKAE